MVKIRLMRVGKKKQAAYRVVVADSRSPRDGRIIESIGYYHPRQDPSEISIDPERAVHWLERGAQPSDQVRKLLQISGAWAVFRGEAPMSSALGPAAAPAPAGSAPVPKPKKKVTAAASVVEATPAGETETAAESEAGPDEDATADKNENQNVE